MLLCLSSGAKPRYRQDILRALALPQGAVLRFRYDAGYVAESLKEPLAQNKLADQAVCLAYLDSSEQGKEPEIVPCRVAKLTSSKPVGEFFILELEVGDFSIAKDIGEFNRQVRTLAGSLPAWRDGKLVGKFCEKLSSPPSSVVSSSGVGEWQGLCRTLADHNDFKAEPFFYRVEGLFPAGSNESLPLKQATWEVEAGRLYDLRVVHYSGRGVDGGVSKDEPSWVTVESDEKAISFVSNRLLAVDSRYDEKSFRLRTATTNLPLDTRLTLNRRTGQSTSSESLIWDFDLQVHIEPRWWTMAWQGLVVGAGLSFQGLVITWNSPNIQNKPLVSTFVVLAAIFTGLAASFGLRKP